MFSKSSLGIQRGVDDKITTRIEGSPTEVLVLLSTLNAKVIAELAETPREYAKFSTKIQENTMKIYLAILSESKEDK